MDQLRRQIEELSLRAETELQTAAAHEALARKETDLMEDLVKETRKATEEKQRELEAESLRLQETVRHAEARASEADRDASELRRGVAGLKDTLLKQSHQLQESLFHAHERIHEAEEDAAAAKARLAEAHRQIAVMEAQLDESHDA